MRTILIGALVMLASLGAVGATPSAPAPTVFVGENELGEIFIVDAPSAAPDHSGSCLMNPFCTTGTHTRTSGISHGFTLYAGYSGAMVSALVGPAGSQNSRVFVCFANNGVIQACQGQGTFPAIGQSFDHDCLAGGAFVIAAPTCQIVH